MMVVSDTSALSYLVLIKEIDLLPRLFGRVLIPPAVCDELQDPQAPAPIRKWIANPAHWLEVRPIRAHGLTNANLEALDAGEREAIVLAEQLRVDLKTPVLMVLDERAARQTALQRGLNVTGLLGILDEAATRDWIDLPSVVERLQQTSFRASPSLLKTLLERHHGVG